MRTLAPFVAAAALVAVMASACGGSSTPVSPSPTPAGGGNAVTISMLGNDDSSFSPSPATVPQGSTVMWSNIDGTPHQVVADDRSFDTGVVAPGRSSAPMVLSHSGVITYHCALHPAEVGSINP